MLPFRQVFAFVLKTPVSDARQEQQRNVAREPRPLNLSLLQHVSGGDGRFSPGGGWATK